MINCGRYCYRLIIADDKATIRNGLQKFVEIECPDFEVAGVYADGEQVIEHIRRKSVDVIITDISMPKASGIEIAEFTRDVMPDAFVIMITGYREFEYAKKAIDLGVSRLIMKPIDFEDLYSTLQDVAVSIERKKREALEQTQSILRQRDSLRIQISLIVSGFLSVHALDIYSGMWRFPANSCRCAWVNFSWECSSGADKLNWSANTWRDMCENRTDEYDAFCLRETPQSADFFVFCPVDTKALVQKIIEDFCCQASKLLHSAYQIEPVYKIQLHDRMEEIRNHDIETVGRMYISNMIQGDEVELILNVISKSFSPEMRVTFLKAAASKLRDDYGINTDEFVSQIEKVMDPKEFPHLIERLNKLITEHLAAEQGIIVAIKRYIKKHCDMSLSRSRVAEAFSLHPNYLSTMFKNKTGESFADYTVRARIRKSMVLLRQGAVEVRSVGEMVGYSNEKHFERIFKKQMGMSPRQYRELESNDETNEIR